MSFEDVQVLEQWYLLDEKVTPSVYRLQDPDERFTKILSRSVSTYELSTRENHEWNDAYSQLVDLFLAAIHDKPHSKSNTLDIQLLSAMEILFHFSIKLSSSGCMCVLRQLDGMLVCAISLSLSLARRRRRPRVLSPSDSDESRKFSSRATFEPFGKVTGTLMRFPLEVLPTLD